MAERVLTHHVNLRNTKGNVVTYEPGEALPKWAAEALTAENHAAYPEATAQTTEQVKQWQASRLAADNTQMED
jgi:hypothetical protein